MFGPSHDGGSHNSLVQREAFTGKYRLGQDQHSNLLLPTVRGVVIQACRGVEVKLYVPVYQTNLCASFDQTLRLYFTNLLDIDRLAFYLEAGLYLVI